MALTTNKLNGKKSADGADTQPFSKEAFADQKRIQSIIAMRKSYQQQKNTIKAALSRVDISPNKKIVFDTEETGNSYKVENSDKKALFNDDDDDIEYNFEVKDYLDGKKGKKLMELQSKFKNDKRFIMDEKFIDDENEDNEQDIQENGEYDKAENNTEITKEEKQKEISILEDILGEKVKRRDTNIQNKSLSMYYYDPLAPEQNKYISTEDEKLEKKTKRKADQLEEPEENQEVKKPYVSKETFYEVNENLKETLEQNESFSFLNIFKGHPEVEKETNKISDEALQPNASDSSQLDKKNHKYTKENPFQYDSSEESENDEILENINDKDGIEENDENQTAAPRLWTESLFFIEDDYRLQEGIDFVKKFELDDTSEFKQVRRNIKEIVRAKIRHNQRKDKPFKKKLGGKRMIKIKKALKNK